MHPMNNDGGPPRAIYCRAAITHLTQMLVLVVAINLALLTMSVLVAVIAWVVAEAALITVLPRSARFRASVDESFSLAARVAAAERRNAWLARMSDPHLEEFNELEALAEECELVMAGARSGSEVGVERTFSLQQLLVSYVRLAITHRRLIESFEAQGRAALDERGARLASIQAPSGSPASEWVTRRRALLEKRHRTWARVAEECEAIAQQLATIADALRWAHELCAVGPEDRDRAEIDETLASCAAALASSSVANDTDAPDAALPWALRAVP
jgi:hypothetical protein